MKRLEIPFAEDISSFDQLSLYFKTLIPHKIEQVSWSAYPYCPDVKFKIAYNDSAIFLEYIVKEKDFQALHTEINQPVYKDSCVEFFISFDEEHYYNMEFNALGVAIVGYGPSDRSKRQRLPVAIIEKIKKRSIIKTREVGEDQYWTLQIQIPIKLFYQENIGNLKGKIARANFYKCGDDLPEPHFISWNKIKADQPNFHLPDYFGEIEFG